MRHQGYAYVKETKEISKLVAKMSRIAQGSEQVRREKDHLKNASIFGKRNHLLTLLLDPPVLTSLFFNSKLASMPHQMTAWREGIY